MSTVTGHLLRVDTFLTMIAEDIEEGNPGQVPAYLDRAQLRTRSALSVAKHSVVIGSDPKAQERLITVMQMVLEHLLSIIDEDDLMVTRLALPKLRARVESLLKGLDEYSIIPLPPRAEDDRPVFDAESIHVAAAPPHAPKVGDIWVDTTKDISVCTFDGTWVSATSR